MIECKVMRTLASVEIEIILILGLLCCLSSSSMRYLKNDPDEAIRQAYLVGTDAEFEPFEDLVKTETPKSPHTVAPPTCHVKKSEGSGTFGARSMSSYSIALLSPNHPLTHTTPVLVSSLCRNARMAMRVPPAMSPSLSISIAKVAAMPDLAFCKRFRSSYDSSPSPTFLVWKRYRGTSKLILDTNSERDELGDKDDKEEEEEESERPKRVSAFRHPTLTTWIDPMDGIAYIDVLAYPPSAPLVQTLASPEWSSGSLPISLAPSIVPLPILSPMISLIVPSLVASPATAEAKGFLTELGAQVEMQGGLIRDHTLTEVRRMRLDLAEIVDSMRRGKEPKGDV
nr:hypothetical protein [Tanacetum cinerariifolium]